MRKHRPSTRILLICGDRSEVADIKLCLAKSIRVPNYIWQYNTLAEALAILNSKKLRADIIILDLGLVGSNSPQSLYEEVARAASGIPIVVITSDSSSDRDLAVFAMESGASDRMVIGEFTHLKDVIEFSLIRHRIVAGTKAAVNQKLREVRDQGNKKYKDSCALRLRDLEDSKNTLSMLMGGYSVFNHDKE